MFWQDGYRSEERSDDCVVLASLDLKNAFNALGRSIILKFVEDNFPMLVGYFVWLYGNAFDVLFGDEKIKSERGGLSR